MKFPKPQSLESIANLLKCQYIGKSDSPIIGINEIHTVKQGDVVFVDHPKYYNKALNSRASVVLINREVTPPEGKALLISKQPFADFNRICQHFFPEEYGTEQQASLSKIAKSSIIQHGVVIGKNVSIGEDCIIHPNVVIKDHTVIKNRVIIQAGSIIGSNAFYYKKHTNKQYSRLFSCGNVVIEDDVEIGAGCTIDRGVTASTFIGKGTKIDNQVHLGHDTIIGKNCLIASQAGIAGCTTLEDNVTLWGQVGITSDVTIGESTVILAKSGITKTLKGHKTYFGAPAGESFQKLKELAVLRSLTKK